MTARWFTPLLLLCFALFVLGAKAYISRTPTEVIQAPVIEPPQRIYGVYPAAARREEANARVFKPRPRMLEPMPIMAMNRPIIEPVRPGSRAPATAATPLADAVKSAIALATAAPVAPASPPKATDETRASSPGEEQPTSTTADDAVLSVAAVIAVEKTDGLLRPEFSNPVDPDSKEVASSEAPASQSNAPDTPPNSPLPGWRDAILAAAEQIDSAAVRLRSNYENGPAVVLARAFESLASGQFDSAIREFDAVLARNPNQSQAWSGKGEALVGLNRFEEAAIAYERAIADPSAPLTAKYNYGVVLYRLSRYAEAAVQFRAVASQAPNHAEAHYNLATLAQREGRLSEALEEWSTFTRLQPKVAGGWFNLGIVQMDYDRPAEAVACFKRVIELDRNDADAHINLAMAYMASDQPAEALTALEAAESRLPGDRVVLRYLAEVHTQLAELGGPDASIHREKAATCRTRIAAAPTRDQRKAVAGSQGEVQP